MTHAAMAPEAQQAAGIGAGLIRLSVGIEHADDLVADLEKGLSRSQIKPVGQQQHGLQGQAHG